MEINELYIKNFGKFKEKHFLLYSGIHVFYGENEYGKSTIYAFIKAMLFGLERGRGRAAQNDEFSRYEPWDNPNYYAGVMRFSSGGKNFRLERSFDRYSKSVSLVCEDDGEEFSLEDGDLAILLGGITKENFENTVAINQLTAKPGQELAEALKNYAANYYETGGNLVDLSGAFDTLRLRKKALEHELRELKNSREQSKHDIFQRMDYVGVEVEKMQKELNDSQKKLKGLRSQLSNKNLEENGTGSCVELTSDYTAKSVYKGMGLVKAGTAGIVIGALGSVGCIIAQVQSWLERTQFLSILFNFSVILLSIGIVLCGAGGIRLFMQRNQNKKCGQQEEAVGGTKELEMNIQKLEWETEHIRFQWKEKKTEYQNLEEELEEVELPGEKMQALVHKKQALELAEEMLRKASKDMTQGFGSALNKKASRILERITAGKYSKLFIDEQLNMAVVGEGKRIPVERVSKGTIEQIYFSLRMAASELLCEEPMPIIADDAFAYYDEKRLKSTLKWLREQSRQAIIFTCQKREAEIALFLKGRDT